MRDTAAGDFSGHTYFRRVRTWRDRIRDFYLESKENQESSDRKEDALAQSESKELRKMKTERFRVL